MPAAHADPRLGIRSLPRGVQPLVVGVKMLLAESLKPAWGRRFNLSLLAVVIAILGAGEGGSLLADRRNGKPPTGR